MSLEECVKTEPEWDEECGVSEAAACAGLYEGHFVKDELVIGPELLQPRDVAYMLGVAPDESWVKICKQKPTLDHPNVMNCEQSPTTESQSSQPPLLDKPFDYEPEIQSLTEEDKLKNKNNQNQGGAAKEKKTYICDTCSQQFSDRNSLIRHLRIHTKEKPPPLRDCFVKLERITLDKPFDYEPEIQSLTEEDKLRNKNNQNQAGEAKEKKTYICDTCSQQFLNRNSLIRHLRIHTKEKPPPLQDCFVKLERITLDKPFDYELEVQTPTEEDKLRNKNNENQGGEVKEKKSYICDTCSKKFSDRQSLIKHLRIHTKGKLYICNTCSKWFSDRKSFIIHIRIHTGLKPYTCEICEKKFARVPYLAKHKLIHEDWLYSCEICEKKFLLKDSLKRHILKHTERKRFSCEVCRKKLASQNSLDRHKLTHTGEKPFSCGICEKQYRHQSTLVKHIRMHTQKTYECDQKLMSHQNSYNYKQQLQNIGKKTHKLNLKEKCDVCKKQFSSWYLTTHKQTHTKPFQCEICENKFSTKRLLLSHYTVHTGVKAFSCETCGYKFARADHLSRHRRRHTGEKPFSCNICEKRFKDKHTVTLHMRIHTGEKPYGCRTCGKRFRQSSNIKKHERIHDLEMTD